MKLISTVSSDHDALDCDYAVIDLTPDLARLALRRVSILKAQKYADPQLDEMYFWDYHVEHFSLWSADEGNKADSLSEMLGKLPTVAGDLMSAPDGFAVAENLLARVECSQMIVRELCDRPHNSRYVAESIMWHSAREAALEENRALPNAT